MADGVTYPEGREKLIEVTAQLFYVARVLGHVVTGEVLKSGVHA